MCWSDGLCGIELRNGLVSRRFVTSPAFGTVDLLLNTTRDRGGLYVSRHAAGLAIEHSYANAWPSYKQRFMERETNGNKRLILN